MIEYYENKTLCIEGGWLTSEGVMTESNYKLMVYRNKMNRLQRGGNGRPALIEYESIPPRFRKAIELKLGYDPTQAEKHSFFRKHLVVDKDAVTFFSNFQTQTGSPLPIERQKEYHQNAMFLNAIHAVKNKTTARRKAMGGFTGGIWNALSKSVNDLRDEFGHTLPANAIRLREKSKQFQQEGFTCLIHRGYGNNNSRKVNQELERLILSRYVMNNKPYPTMVRDIYLEFLSGKVDIIDQGTGELFDRQEFYSQKGLPLVISEATIWNYVNNPKNRAIVDSQRNDYHYYNNIHRPHHHRVLPRYSLSKISLDDRDLQGKFIVGGKKQRVKAYYAYDVASGALIGTAYSKDKDKELYLACLRNMFGFLNGHGLGFPLEMEVEHHIVNKFADDLMKAGTVFPHVRWCNAGNSQEKRAEHFNRQKKYGFEKRYNDGVGRWTLTEANRPKQDKVWDDDGMQIRETIYEFEELVANDLFTVEKYNNGLHPDQKKYKGMSRLQVFLANVNPNTVIFQDHIVAQYAGQSVNTSIRRNQYVRVNYENYSLPSVEIIDRLQSNNYKVEAFYLPDENGEIDKVHIFQNGQFLATCQKINKYNEATAEQTATDNDYFLEQSKYVAAYDGMIRKGRNDKTTKLHITTNEDFKDVEAEVVDRIPDAGKTMDDWDEIANRDYSDYAKKASIDL